MTSTHCITLAHLILIFVHVSKRSFRYGWFSFAARMVPTFGFGQLFCFHSAFRKGHFNVELPFWLIVQNKTMQMMYETIYKALVEVGLEDAFTPQDYLNFYCLGNREVVGNEFSASSAESSAPANSPQVSLSPFPQVNISLSHFITCSNIRIHHFITEVSFKIYIIISFHSSFSFFPTHTCTRKRRNIEYGFSCLELWLHYAFI